MKSFAVAIFDVNSKSPLRPPRPASHAVNSNVDLPGAALLTAVAIAVVNSNRTLRPPRSAKAMVSSTTTLPGAPFCDGRHHD